MSNVRAKFNVSNIEWQGEPGESQAIVRLTPVTSGSKENEGFFQWTPGGHIELATVNPAAARAFDEVRRKANAEGRQPSFYVDFTPAD